MAGSRAPVRAGAALALVGLAMAAAPARLPAQVAALSQRCAAVAPDAQTERFCRLVAQAVEDGQPRFGLAMAGGNPVPGTASTLGWRLARVPRATVAARASAAPTRLPPIRRRGATDDVRFVLPSLNVDGALGLFQGFSPAPTVGGVASVDLLASIGWLPLPSAAGLAGGSPWSGAAGARVGIFRESFTLPGVSVAGTVRRIGPITVGDPDLVRRDAAFHLSDHWVTGLRAAVGKRIALVNVTALAGYDRAATDVRMTVAGPDGARVSAPVSGFRTRRWSGFLNASYTTLILHLVAEAGYQQGGDRVPGEFPAGVTVESGRGGFVGGLAVRLSI